MSPSVFSPLGPRFCQWCQKPLQGRSDQKFCHHRCRSMSRRHGEPADARINWPARAEAAEQTVRELHAQLDQQAQAQLAAQPYEQRYEELSLILAVLAREAADGQVRSLAPYIEFVDQVLRDYQQHSGLRTGEVAAQRRLASLQRLREELVASYQSGLARQQQELQRKEHAQQTEHALTSRSQ